MTEKNWQAMTGLPRTSHIEKELVRNRIKGSDPVSSTPHGTLVKHTAVCRGYASSFHLLMDTLGIECITTGGTINVNNGPHAWDIVRLEDTWYCVDVGCDDPIDGSPYRPYFNRISKELKVSNCNWDQTPVPEAVGRKHAGENAA